MLENGQYYWKICKEKNSNYDQVIKSNRQDNITNF